MIRQKFQSSEETDVDADKTYLVLRTLIKTKNINIVFIPCGASKLYRKTKAQYMYRGYYYHACLSLARWLAKKEHIFILSAKYGMLGLEEEIEPYELRLSKQGKKYQLKWRNKVLRQMRKLPKGKRIFICPNSYAKFFKGLFLLPQVGILIQVRWINRVVYNFRRNECIE